ncbi:Sec-independent protein secretion pathway component TatC [Halalkaliarchaeum sp. AArc-CO]|uniref:twin-arginine translocase subunit TatC n=1 Tax=unclassified Halalkaliarchaeum TaxID=2678344 RepID=UPI00217E5687|nr:MULTISPECIES: twin-arginine translocase subunit TatC [unclassified Halalkaliarchaeum]MDR5673383.1 twin-arginine translocase subunit TatC [Halalkaliarchaeum sp. AArc-GB]UWG49724.1 Sec-independent protein secretion pathway component TatC [Halalkaliarchaeum sp. AArc-CO]
MSSALDEDTQQTLAEGSDAVRAMLRSAQKDLQKAFMVFLFVFLGTFYALRLWVWDYLKGVTRAQMPPDVEAQLEIIVLTPFDVILLQAKIGLIVGVIAAIPPLIYFSREALRERDMWPDAPIPRWKMATIGVLAALLFAGGVFYGQSIFFPFMFAFLASFGLEAGFAPSYSIVMWTEFIVFLSLSFGLAAQMPLVVTGLSYAGIVQYETFRDKWKYAVVLIFVFGAMFSPPDPFTQIMWAVPLIALYGVSLYLAKIAVTARRRSETIDVPTTIRRKWNVLAGLFVVGVAAVYGFYDYGGRQAANDLLAWMGSDYRIVPLGEGLGVAEPTAIALYGLLTGVLFAVLGLMYLVYAGLDPEEEPELYGDPTAIDLGELDAGGVRAAPIEAFEELSEDEVMQLASAALDADDPEKAQALLDRFDEVEAQRAESDDGNGAAGASGAAGGASAGEAAEDIAGELGERGTRAGSTFLEELTEDDEDDIGGYYKDLKFIFDSVRSRSFIIVGTFLAVMAATFTWLYLGGLGNVFDNFLGRLPSEVVAENVNVITLHPVEALIFIVKFSVLVGVLAIFPVIAYYAWPALRELGFVRGRQNVVFLWTGALVGGLIGGFMLGYYFFAPWLISYLVGDALDAGMIISYRINDFFWLIVFTTAGIGILADVPVLMVLLNYAGIPYQAMRNRWREVLLAMLTFAAVFTPADIVTMFLVTIPLMAAYGIGLFVLFFVTLGGRRNLSPPAEIVDTTSTALEVVET